MEIINIEKYTVKQKGKPNNKRAEAIQQLADLIGVPFSVVLHKTFKMKEFEITEIFLTAKSWDKNPPALANILIRQKNEEIKLKISTKNY